MPAPPVSMAGAAGPRGRGAPAGWRRALVARLACSAAAVLWADAAAFAAAGPRGAAPPRVRRGSAAAVRRGAFGSAAAVRRGAFGWARLRAFGSTPATAALEDAIKSADVVFFDDPTCPYCRQAELALRAEGIDFTLFPIAEHKEALEAKTQKTSAPSVWIKGTYIGGCNDGTEPWHGVKPCIESGKIKELLEDPAVRAARFKAMRNMLGEIKKRAEADEREKHSLAAKVEKLEATTATVKKDTKAAAQEALDMRAKMESAESETESFREALSSIAETVSAAVNGPDDDPVKLLKAAVADIAASEETAAQLLKEKDEASQQVEALEKKLEKVARVRAKLEAAREKARRLSAGIDSIATGVGLGGGNLFSLFSAPTDEEKVKSILERVKALQT